MGQTDTVGTLADLDQKQRVRLTLDDGTVVEGRVSQCEYTPADRLRLELTPKSGDDGRYQARSEHGEDGWHAVELRHAGEARGEREWRSLGTVREVVPLETSGFPDREG